MYTHNARVCLPFLHTCFTLTHMTSHLIYLQESSAPFLQGLKRPVIGSESKPDKNHRKFQPFSTTGVRCFVAKNRQKRFVANFFFKFVRIFLFKFFSRRFVDHKASFPCSYHQKNLRILMFEYFPRFFPIFSGFAWACFWVEDAKYVARLTIWSIFIWHQGSLLCGAKSWSALLHPKLQLLDYPRMYTIFPGEHTWLIKNRLFSRKQKENALSPSDSSYPLDRVILSKKPIFTIQAY